jgi:hypothetical protein
VDAKGRKRKREKRQMLRSDDADVKRRRKEKKSGLAPGLPCLTSDV